ncbi:MAG: peptidyl-prolyl cis-trans isomerase [Pseudomonadota bacterium]
MKHINITYILIFSLLSIVGCSDKGGVIATIGNDKIYRADLKGMMNDIVHSYGEAPISGKLSCANLKTQALNRLIHDKLLNTESKKRGIGIPESELKSWLKDQTGESPSSEWIEKQRQRLTNKKLAIAILNEKLPLTNEQIESYYQSNKSSFVKPKSFHLIEISVDDKSKAKSILSLLRDGENFAKLAKKFSNTPSAKDSGDLGFISSEQLSPLLVDVFSNLKPGEYIMQKINKEYKIFGVLKTRPEKTLTLDEARESIVEKIYGVRSQIALNDWLNELKNSINIKINDELIGEIKCHT